ncbi:MAG: hypothetical protein PHS60_11560, partial [Zavarzinia sp.]|nr:hypothetical protein [Zavarzinia sp.]
MRAYLLPVLVAAGLGLATPLAAQQPATPAAAEAPRPAVGARGWDHGDYGRLVFDLAPGVDAAPRLDGTTLNVTFDRPVRLDPAQAMRRLSRIATDATLSADGLSLAITLAGPAALKAERYEDKLVLDLRPGPAPAAPKPESSKPERPKPAPVKPEAPVPQPAKPAPAPVPPAAAPEPVKPEPVRPEPVKPEPVKPEAAKPEPAPPKPVPTPVTPAPVSPAPAAARYPEGPTVPVTRRRGPSGAEIEMAFAAPVAAAVFGRGDSLWFVFDGPGGGASAALADALEGLGQVTVLDVPGGSGFRLAGRPLPPQVSNDGDKWRFLFADEARPPVRPLVASPRADEAGHMRLVADAPGARAPIDLTDPDMGGRLTVVPVAQGGAGVVVGGRLPDLEMLPTVQGIAFLPLADGITARVEGDQVVIGRDGAGLTMSD